MATRNDINYVANLSVADDQELRSDIRSCNGINTFYHETEVQDTQATVLNNADISTAGQIKKRLGTNQVLTTSPTGANPVVVLNYFNAPNVDERMIAITGARVYDSTSPLTVAGSWVDIEGADGFTADTYSTSAIIADDRLYLTNGTDHVHYHNGSGITQESDQNVDPPFCKVGCYFKNRLWLANETRRATVTGNVTAVTPDPLVTKSYLKITLDSGTFDDVDLDGDTSIDDVVTSINAHTGFAAKGLAWKDTDGYLRISSLTVGATSSVAVEDGTNDDQEATEILFDGVSVSGTGQTNPEYVYYSNALATETFSRSTQVFKVESGDATEITALVPQGDSIIIFKETSVHELIVSGASATYWNLRPVETRYGCASYNCAVNNAGTIYYLSYTGVRTLGGQYAELPMSKLIKTTWDTINWDYITRARMITHDNKVYIAVPTGSTTYPDKVLVWDILAEGWSIITGINVGCWGIYRELTAGSASAYEETLMYGDANSTKIHHVFKSTQFQDASTDVNFLWETKAFDFGSPRLTKAGGLFELRIITGGGVNTTVSAAIDGGSYTQLGTCTATTVFHLDSLGEFKTIKFKIQQNDTNTAQTAYNGFTVEAYAVGFKGE